MGLMPSCSVATTALVPKAWRFPRNGERFGGWRAGGDAWGEALLVALRDGGL